MCLQPILQKRVVKFQWLAVKVSNLKWEAKSLRETTRTSPRSQFLWASTKQPSPWSTKNASERPLPEVSFNISLSYLFSFKIDLPASLLVVKYKQKDIINGLTTILNNYFEVQGSLPATGTAGKDLNPQQKMYSPEILTKTIKLMNRLLVIDQ